MLKAPIPLSPTLSHKGSGSEDATLPLNPRQTVRRLRPFDACPAPFDLARELQTLQAEVAREKENRMTRNVRGVSNRATVIAAIPQGIRAALPARDIVAAAGLLRSVVIQTLSQLARRGDIERVGEPGEYLYYK